MHTSLSPLLELTFLGNPLLTLTLTSSLLLPYHQLSINTLWIQQCACEQPPFSAGNVWITVTSAVFSVFVYRTRPEDTQCSSLLNLNKRYWIISRTAGKLTESQRDTDTGVEVRENSETNRWKDEKLNALGGRGCLHLDSKLIPFKTILTHSFKP